MPLHHLKKHYHATRHHARRHLLPFTQRYRRLSFRTRTLLKLVIIILLLLSLPTLLRHRSQDTSGKAELYFLPLSQNISAGQDFPVELRVKTNGTSLNAQQFVIHFDPHYLEVLGMTTEQSFCTFYLENIYDNVTGEIRVACGIPRPGFLGDALGVRLQVHARSAGSTTLTLDPKHSQLLANDGKGSNIMKAVPELPLAIKQL